MPHYRHILWGFLFLLYLAAPSRASTPSFHHYGSQDGLINPNIFSIAQDSLGYLWLGTDKGMSRFDGSKFLNFNSDSLIRQRTVTNFLQYKGNFYAGAYKGQIAKVIYESSDRIRLEPLTRDLHFEISLVGKDSLLYSGGGNKHNLWSISLKTGQQKRLLTARSREKTLSLNRLYQRKNKDILLSSNKGLYKWDSNQLIPYYEQYLKDTKTIALHENEAGGLWVGSFGHLYYINPDGELHTYTENLPPDQYIHQILEDEQSNLWLSIVGLGLCKYYPESRRLEHTGKQLGIDNMTIHTFYKDHEKNIWIGTESNGIYCIYNSPFTHYTIKDELASNQITSLAYTKDNHLFIGTTYGLSVLDNYQIKQLAIPDQNDFYYIRKIHYFSDNKLYISAQNLEPLEEISHEYKTIPLVYSNLFYDFAIQANNKYVVMGIPLREKDLAVTRKSKRLKKFLQNGIHYLIYPDAPARSIHQLNDSLYLIGMDKGIRKQLLYPLTDPPETYLSNWPYHLPPLEKFVAESLGDQDVADILNSRINAIAPSTQQQRVWIATDKGLAYFENERWHTFSKNKQLPNNCNAVLEDTDGRVWIGTEEGLFCVVAERLYHWDVNKGMISNNINSLAYNEASAELAIGTVSGLSILNLKKTELINVEAPPPFFHLKNIQTPDSNYHVLPQSSISLPYTNAHIKVQFLALHYINPKEVSYQYQLFESGFTRQDTTSIWQDINSHELALSSLEPAAYTLKIRAKTPTSLWSNPKIIRFHIPRPFWQNPLFILLVAIASILLVALLAYLIIVRIRQRELEKRKTVAHISELKQQALSAMMNPHFIFNSLNSIQHYINKYEREAANDYLVKFARLIRSNMRLSEKTFITLAKELDHLRLYMELEKMRFGENLFTIVEVAPSIDLQKIQIPAMTLQPYVENAIWHGLVDKNKEGKVKIVIIPSNKTNFLEIQIEDNGIGIEKSKEMKFQESKHISQGMRITKERLQHLYLGENLEAGQVSIQELKDDNKQILGTRVTLLLPIF